MSFLSGHSTEDSHLRTGIKAANTTLAAGTLWARPEGQRHYPSDVLVGYALGTFLSGFIYDSLMNLDSDESFSIIPLGDQASASYSIQF
ncbi:MAG: hypothetical protein NDI69_10890 [Bacteriovoracaceae bacterium]|nr:hypothetical protein [Bacteriovoracaceae bacterium]